MLIRGVLVIVAIVFGAMPAFAAHLEITDVQKTEEMPQETLAPCTGNTTTTTMSNVGPNGQSIMVSVDGQGSIDGDIEDCEFKTIAVATRRVTAEIEPAMGENPGDRVRMCVQYVNQQAAGADPEPPYTANSSTGGIPPDTKPLSIKRNQRPVFLQGPNFLPSDGERIDEFQCQFGAVIGDTIEINIGLRLELMGNGIGAAQAEASQDLDLSIGGCDEAPLCLVETTPAVSPLNLGAIAILLASAGAVMVRVRARKRERNG